MTEVPGLWWSPTLGVLRREQGQEGFHVYGGGSAQAWGWFLEQQWPDDAVQLADPETCDQLRTRLAARENINRGWQEYKLRKQAERERHIAAFEDALGLPHEGRGFWYERMIEAAAKVREERDQLRARNTATIAKCDDVLATSQNEFERAVAFVVRGVLEDGRA